MQVLRDGASFRGQSALRTWIARIDSHAADNEQAARLLAASTRLPAEQRVVLGLFAFDGLAGADIAEILGVPTGTVHSRLHTARTRLRALLESKQPPAPAVRTGR